jgi:hypothetical protein
LGPDTFTLGNKQASTAGTGIVGDVNTIVDGTTGYIYGLYASKRVSGLNVASNVIFSAKLRVYCEEFVPPAEIPFIIIPEQLLIIVG